MPKYFMIHMSLVTNNLVIIQVYMYKLRIHTLCKEQRKKDCKHDKSIMNNLYEKI